MVPEALIQQALGAELANRTAILIAHSLTTILYADQVLALDRGRLVERGGHNALIAERGRYFTLVWGEPPERMTRQPAL